MSKTKPKWHRFGSRQNLKFLNREQIYLKVPYLLSNDDDNKNVGFILPFSSVVLQALLRKKLGVNVLS